MHVQRILCSCCSFFVDRLPLKRQPSLHDPETEWILDGTFYKQQWRDRFRGFGDVTLAYITADLETCLERNRHRDDPIDEQGVYVIYHEFDEPEADIVLNTDVLAPNEAVEQLRDGIEENCQS